MHGMAKALAVGLLLGAGAAPARSAADELAIRNAQFAVDTLGPQREGFAYFPGERVCARWDVVGAAPATDGLVDFEVTYRLTSAGDKLEMFDTAFVTRRPWKGSDGFSRVNLVLKLPDHLQPGTVVLECTVEDKVAGARVKFEQELTVKEAAFALVSPTFSYDAEGKVPAPLGGTVGQALHFAVGTVGEDRTQEAWEYALDVRVLNDRDEEAAALVRPIVVATAERRVIENPQAHPLFRSGLVLDQPGSFTLRLTVTDKASGATAQLDLPIEIVDPSAPATLASRGTTTR